MVTWSAPAKADLKNIFDYIAKDSRYYAKKVVKSIVEKSLELAFLPQKGRIVPEICDINIREVFIYSYRLMYEIDGNHICVLGVIHGKRDFEPEL